MITDLNPKQTARELHVQGFTVRRYMVVQDERKARLKRFEEIGIPVLIEEAKKLVEFGEQVITEMKVLNVAKFIHNMIINSVEWMGTKYYYEHRPAQDGEICLATTDPKLYCNGVYTFSSKDPGDGMAFVVLFTDKDED